MLGIGIGITSTPVLSGVVRGVARITKARIGDTVHLLLPTVGNPPNTVPTIQWHDQDGPLAGETGIALVVPATALTFHATGIDNEGNAFSTDPITVLATITVTEEPTAAGLTTAAAGETASALLARLTKTGTATTNGTGAVTTSLALYSGGAEVTGAVAENDVLDSVLVTYSAPGADDVPRRVSLGITVTGAVLPPEVYGLDDGSYIVNGDTLTISGDGVFDGDYDLAGLGPDPAYIVPPVVGAVDTTYTLTQGVVADRGDDQPVTCTVRLLRGETNEISSTVLPITRGASVTYERLAGDRAAGGVSAEITLAWPGGSSSAIVWLVAPDQPAIISYDVAPETIADMDGDGADWDYYVIRNTLTSQDLHGTIRVHRPGTVWARLQGGGESGSTGWNPPATAVANSGGGAAGEGLVWQPFELVGDVPFVIGGGGAPAVPTTSLGVPGTPGGDTIFVDAVARGGRDRQSGPYVPGTTNPERRVKSGGPGSGGNSDDLTGTAQLTPAGDGGAPLVLTVGTGAGARTVEGGWGGGSAPYNPDNSGFRGGLGSPDGGGAARNPGPGSDTTAGPVDATPGTGSGGAGTGNYNGLGVLASRGAGGFILLRVERET